MDRRPLTARRGKERKEGESFLRGTKLWNWKYRIVAGCMTFTASVFAIGIYFAATEQWKFSILDDFTFGHYPDPERVAELEERKRILKEKHMKGNQ